MVQEDLYVIGTMLVACIVVALVILKIKKKDPIQPLSKKQRAKVHVSKTKQYQKPLEHNDEEGDDSL